MFSSSCVLGLWSSDRGIPCLKGSNHFLEFCMLNRARTLFIYPACDKPNILLLRSCQNLIPRIKFASPKSFISNWLDNQTIIDDITPYIISNEQNIINIKHYEHYYFILMSFVHTWFIKILFKTE